jgi:hypothetical protein
MHAQLLASFNFFSLTARRDCANICPVLEKEIGWGAGYESG